MLHCNDLTLKTENHVLVSSLFASRNPHSTHTLLLGYFTHYERCHGNKKVCHQTKGIYFCYLTLNFVDYSTLSCFVFVVLLLFLLFCSCFCSCFFVCLFRFWLLQAALVALLCLVSYFLHIQIFFIFLLYLFIRTVFCRCKLHCLFKFVNLFVSFFNARAFSIKNIITY